MRTGDTQSNERQKLIRRPPDLLITTPESLYLMLTSSARETLQGVETVIVDEIHAMATTKRGAHLALTLERLEEVTDRPPQRIGLSATQRPLEETARFLGGYVGESPRPVRIVDAGVRKALEIEVVVPVDDMSAPGRCGDAARRARRRRAAVEHLAQHLPPGARTGAGAPVARSSSATPAARPSDWPPSSTSSTRSSTARPSSSWSAPTTARSPASSG